MKSGGTVPKASLSLGHQQQLFVKLPPSESQRKRHIDPALLDFMPSLSARHAQLWLPRKCKPLLCVAFWTPPAALPKSQSQQHPLQGAYTMPEAAKTCSLQPPGPRPSANTVPTWGMQAKELPEESTPSGAEHDLSALQW